LCKARGRKGEGKRKREIERLGKAERERGRKMKSSYHVK
jgi:hypothetical protein